MITLIKKGNGNNLDLVLVYYNNTFIGICERSAVSDMLAVMGIEEEA